MNPLYKITGNPPLWMELCSPKIHVEDQTPSVSLFRVGKFKEDNYG